MEKWQITAVTVLSALLLVIACGPKVAGPPQSPTPGLAPAVVSEWNKVVVAAKEEGAVNVYTATMPLPAQRPLAEAFEKEYGIKVLYASATGTELAEKIAAEQRGKAYTADVSENGSGTTYNLIKPLGILAEPIRVPAALERDKWRGEPFVVDPEGYIFLYNTAPTKSIVINTNLVKPGEEPKSWFDLLDPKWRGKILLDDPTLGGPGHFMFVLVKNYIGGEEYWRKLAEQKPKISRDRRANIEAVAKGEYPVLMGCYSGMLPPFFDARAPLKILIPKEGDFGVQWAIALVKNAPHPNAAKLFVNWFLSREGQMVFAKYGGYPSDRLDVPEELARLEFRWEPGVRVVAFTPKDFDGMTKDKELAKEIFKVGK